MSLGESAVNILKKIGFGIERQMSESDVAEMIDRGDISVSPLLRELIIRDGVRTCFDAVGFCNLFEKENHLKVCVLVKELMGLKQYISFTNVLAQDDDGRIIEDVKYAFERIAILLWVELGDLDVMEQSKCIFE